ncbi:MAG TPA: hypothetical protein VG123_26335 [Streptosporangiaceae bacterium]|jgi:hypothetical protein|nr:hypothetical protein [Streptosporangiaceae bacterium]
MSRSGVLYAVKAMERASAGDAPRVPARRAADHQAAAAAARPGESTSSLARRALAAVRDRIGAAPGRVGQDRRLGGAARAD